jgi:hypothetical protein
MKAYGGVDVQRHIFLTSALVGGEWSASRPDRFTPGERAPSTHWTGGWVGTEPVWTTWRRENSLPYQGLNSDPLVVQPIASHYTNYAIPAPVEACILYKCVNYLCAKLRINLCGKSYNKIRTA